MKVLHFNDYNDLIKPLKTSIFFFLLKYFRKMGKCIMNLSIAYKIPSTVMTSFQNPDADKITFLLCTLYL